MRFEFRKRRSPAELSLQESAIFVGSRRENLLSLKHLTRVELVHSLARSRTLASRSDLRRDRDTACSDPGSLGFPAKRLSLTSMCFTSPCYLVRKLRTNALAGLLTRGRRATGILVAARSEISRAAGERNRPGLSVR